MKKFLMAFVTVALLTVCLCVPAFAFEDCNHTASTPICALDKSLYLSGTCHVDSICSNCGITFNSVDVPLSTVDSMLSGFLDRGVPVMIDGGPLTTGACLHMSAKEMDALSVFVIGGNHYLYCSQCEQYGSVDVLFGTLLSHHSESDCVGCSITAFYLDSDFVIDMVSPLLFCVGDIVTASVNWLTAFAVCIVSNPLLLCFVVLVFVGLGVGLIKRVIRL